MKNLSNQVATFKIVECFYLTSRNSIMVAGDIVDGTISKGNEVKMNETRFKIEQLESSDGKKEGEPVSYVVLQILGDQNLEKVFSQYMNQEIPIYE